MTPAMWASHSSSDSMPGMTGTRERRPWERALWAARPRRVEGRGAVGRAGAAEEERGMAAIIERAFYARQAPIPAEGLTAAGAWCILLTGYGTVGLCTGRCAGSGRDVCGAGRS